MAFGFTQPLAHNDLSGSNLLLPVAADAEVTLIDFEYGSYNYRAYDIAHHFDGKLICPLCHCNHECVKAIVATGWILASIPY